MQRLPPLKHLGLLCFGIWCWSNVLRASAYFKGLSQGKVLGTWEPQLWSAKRTQYLLVSSPQETEMFCGEHGWSTCAPWPLCHYSRVPLQDKKCEGTGTAQILEPCLASMASLSSWQLHSISLIGSGSHCIVWLTQVFPGDPSVIVPLHSPIGECRHLSLASWLSWSSCTAVTKHLRQGNLLTTDMYWEIPNQDVLWIPDT